MNGATPPGKRLGGRFWAFAPIVAFAALVAIVWITLSSGGARNENFATGMLGKPVPAFELAPLRDGAPITPATFKGKRYLVNFFASWCGPCRYEHPYLVDLKARGVSVVGIAYKDAPEKTEAFLQREGDPYAAIGQDPTGRFGLELGIAGVPETFVIDENGVILALHRGPIDDAVMREKILPSLDLR
jgi:cytochrome c biogenesis protein CcmG, thiol:disulfide interchange protein DsbE